MADQAENQNEQPIFRLQTMYVKDISFESPNAPKVFLAQKQDPKVDFDLKLKNELITENNWEVSLAITAKVLDKANGDAVMFAIEIEHAGIFLLKNIPEEHMKRVLAVDCPIMLFPFTRQIVSQISLDGGFMPFLMEPINFVALYETTRNKNQES